MRGASVLISSLFVLVFIVVPVVTAAVDMLAMPV